MVLQRAPKNAVLWGWDTPGAKIIITINKKPSAAEGQLQTTGDNTGVVVVAAADGSWSAQLQPQLAAIGVEISFVSSKGGSTTLSNVAFGDVLF